MIGDIPPFVQESEYAVPSDASWSEKERAIRMRLRQMKNAYNAQFGTDYALPQVSINTLPGAHGQYDPLFDNLRFDDESMLNPAKWNHMLDAPLSDEQAPNTVLHELAHSFAHKEQGQPQGHNENWEAMMRQLAEAYGRAMVQAADEAEGIEYKRDK